MRTRFINGAAIGAGACLVGALLSAPTAANAAAAHADSVGTCATVRAFSAPAGKTYTAPTTASGSRDCRLEIGNQSPAVTRLQQELKDGCDSAPQDIAVDGQFGRATKAALQSAQSTLGITADGIYGSQTASKFAWLTTDGKLCYTPGI
ncbi:peptidoglycan-binding domain-containing protein [Clavibacter michiganensis]|uniref:peptidoglycan-binding domain-containing protein n=1 Tax=Clavibacter michiganensis TaxID=28447 RepID=UPI000B38EB2F|nr:peptidoglycan-binding domain-containing protein [Clavibacter michiganensis]MDO4033459.1 peptidoglycan-binding domain-containing protein [Clavibacter michiganensis]MDO4082237.1 peptidoglycan-binding domain-containing protein [Clavibacter michiganensis]MDO4088341.1 peptidoglycan-binding domain-containing protein [Clavibacter michiganensis]MDO4098320.1 peptidoglycan-binding domain-containing protein [Clavibacter michiganensis]MWJ04304.1 peptidoglycan-binding protein [Clavibacter michiganensis 